MSVRVAVTGQDVDGKSVFVSDETVEADAPRLLSGNRLWQFWGEDGTPHLPHAGETARGYSFYPPAGGYRFAMFEIPPTTAQTEVGDLESAIAEAEKLAPGITHAVSDAAGLHITDTVDLLCVLDGEVWLTVDQGKSRSFTAGDCIVQAGANHAWENRSPDQAARILMVFIGGHRAE